MPVRKIIKKNKENNACPELGEHQQDPEEPFVLKKEYHFETTCFMSKKSFVNKLLMNRPQYLAAATLVRQEQETVPSPFTIRKVFEKM